MYLDKKAKQPTIVLESSQDLLAANASVDELDRAIKAGDLPHAGWVARLLRRILINDLSDQIRTELDLPPKNRVVVVSVFEGWPIQSGAVIRGRRRLDLLMEGSDLLSRNGVDEPVRHQKVEELHELLQRSRYGS